MAAIVDLWAKPVSALRRLDDQTPARSWCARGRGAQWVNATAKPRIALPWKSWAWPRYKATRSTPTVACFRSPAHWDQFGYYPTAGSPTMDNPTTVKLDATWRAATGEDGGILIDNEDGSGVEALNFRRADPLSLFLIQWALDAREQIRTGNPFVRSPVRVRDGDYIADALAVRTPANAGTYRFMGGSTMPKGLAVISAADVASGALRRAIALSGFSQWGPGARVADPTVGWVVEHPKSAPAGYPAALAPGDNPLVPRTGTRLAFEWTDTEITAWLDAKALAGAARRTARVLAVALRDFGFYPNAETGVGDPTIQATGMMNPAEAEAWRSLGVTSEAIAYSLLDGLPCDRLRAYV